MVTQRKRGRPKGTGINDHETLLKIAHLIAANPNMKRTTAIKQAGITNASVVRRLRDKYQEQEHILQAEVAVINSRTKRKVIETAPATRAADAATRTRPGQPAGASVAAPRSTNGQQVREESIFATSQQPKTSGAGQGAAIDPLTALLGGVSIETMVTQFIGQVLGIEAKDIEGSPITALIRQQAHLVDLVLPLLITQFANHKSAKVA